MDCMSRVRYYHFISGVFANQRHDPLCSVCKALTNSVRIVREELLRFEQESAEGIGLLEAGDRRLLDDARQVLDGIVTLPDAVGQKTAGNCRLPKGVCFVKTSKKLVESIT